MQEILNQILSELKNVNNILEKLELGQREIKAGQAEIKTDISMIRNDITELRASSKRIEEDNSSIKGVLQILSYQSNLHQTEIQKIKDRLKKLTITGKEKYHYARDIEFNS